MRPEPQMNSSGGVRSRRSGVQDSRLKRTGRRTAELTSRSASFARSTVVHLRPSAVPILEVARDCHGCGVCVEVCAKGAIAMVEAEGSTRARIDTAKCDLCRKCLEVCPVEAIREPYPPPWREE